MVNLLNMGIFYFDHQRLLKRSYLFSILAAAVASIIYYNSLLWGNLSSTATWILFGILLASLLAQIPTICLSDFPEDIKLFMFLPIAVTCVFLIFSLFFPAVMFIYVLIPPVVLSAVLALFVSEFFNFTFEPLVFRYKPVFLVLRFVLSIAYLVVLALVLIASLIFGIVQAFNSSFRHDTGGGVLTCSVSSLVAGHLFVGLSVFLGSQWSLQVGFVSMSLFSVFVFCYVWTAVKTECGLPEIDNGCFTNRYDRDLSQDRFYPSHNNIGYDINNNDSNSNSNSNGLTYDNYDNTDVSFPL